jgi:filamentous hemagglutinin family protein
LVLVAAAGLASGVAHAGPEGASVVHGSANFDRSGSTTTITTSDRAIIDYRSFNIGAGETVQFVQPNAQSAVLNRINNGSPTSIQGSLLANGRVYIVNPAGVVFGRTSVVNVGHLYAAAASMSNADFLAGNNRFTSARGRVENYGNLTGQTVALIGSQVINHGNIVATGGTVVMASGDTVTIGERLGHLRVNVERTAEGDAARAAAGGGIGISGPALSAGDVYSLAAFSGGLVKGKTVHVESAGQTGVHGRIDATGTRGGDVRVLGQDVGVECALIDASGTSGGGRVNIGGGSIGGEPLRTAETTRIDDFSVVRADGGGSGDGGTIVVTSLTSTRVGGELTARGGSVSGNGGRIETGSGGSVGVRLAADASAANGRGGSWSIGARDVVINGSGTGSGSPTESAIASGVIEDALNNGTSVEVIASGGGGVEGNIGYEMANTIEKTSGGDATLTLRADNNIWSHGRILNSTENQLNVVMDAGRADGAWGLVNICDSIELGSGVLSVRGYRIDAGAFSPEPGRRIVLDAQVIELLARDPGDILLGAIVRTTGQLDTLAPEQVALLSPELQAEYAGDPSIGDYALLIDGGMIDITSPSITTLNGGGVRITNSDELCLSPETVLDLDGRFTQRGGGSVFLGSDISTTGDDVIFTDDVQLIDDVFISTVDFDDLDNTGDIAFNGLVDSAYEKGAGCFFLSADAGNGQVTFAEDIGSINPLKNLRVRGRGVDVGGNVTTKWSQQYIADEVVFRGDFLRSTESSSPTGLETARIEVLSDAFFGFGGNTLLASDLTITTPGLSDADRPSGRGDNVSFAGTVRSTPGDRHDLTIDAGDAMAIFGGVVGGGLGSGSELGVLTVRAAETEIFDDVFTNGMNFFSPVEIRGEDVTMHTGDGAAWFGGDVYSEAGACNSVEFLYSGEPTVGLGTNRTPFKFTGNIGTDAGFNTGLEFCRIRFGDERDTGTAAAGFLFANNALPGDALTPRAGLDLDGTNAVWAIEEIVAGRGQKLTSFGTLDMRASGDGAAVRLGDVNVIGDLNVTADQIVLLARQPGAIEGVSTEDDRASGRPVDLLEDLGAEMIASGDINLNGDVSLDVPPGLTDPVFLFQENGVVSSFNPITGQLDPIGSVSGSFESALEDALYGYDLRLTFDTIPPRPENPNLGTALVRPADFDPRYPDRYQPEADILAELGMFAAPISAVVLREAAMTGSELIADSGATTADTHSALTLDRVSRPSERRLAQALEDLLGADLGNGERAHAAGIRDALAMTACGAGVCPEDFRDWASKHDPRAVETLTRIDAVLAAVEGLELPRYEKSIVRGRVLELIRPVSMSPEQFDRLIRGREAGPSLRIESIDQMAAK